MEYSNDYGEDFDYEHLISLVEAHDIIYNKNHISYRMVDRKEAAWNAIAILLCTDAETVKKKWKFLREKFTRQLSANPSKTSPEEFDWPLMTNMWFVKRQVLQRRRSGSFQSFSPAQSPASPKPITKSVKVMLPKLVPITNDIRTTQVNAIQNNFDEDAAFCNNLYTMLKEIDNKMVKRKLMHQFSGEILRILDEQQQQQQQEIHNY